MFYTLQGPSGAQACLGGCEVYRNLVPNELEGVNDNQGGAELGLLEITASGEEPFHFSLRVPVFNSTAAYYYLVVREQSANRIAFRKIVSKTHIILVLTSATHAHHTE